MLFFIQLIARSSPLSDITIRKPELKFQNRLEGQVAISTIFSRDILQNNISLSSSTIRRYRNTSEVESLFELCRQVLSDLLCDSPNLQWMSLPERILRLRIIRLYAGYCFTHYMTLIHVHKLIAKALLRDRLPAPSGIFFRTIIGYKKSMDFVSSLLQLLIYQRSDHDV